MTSAGRSLAVVLVFVALWSSRARADDTPERLGDDDEAGEVNSAPEVAPPPSVFSAKAVAAAVFPGLLIHGSGHYVRGERETAKKLLSVQAAALAAVILGGVPLAVTGGSSKLVLPTVPLLIGGSAVLMGNWFADLYGTIRGPTRRPDHVGEAGGYRLATERTLSAGVHYRYVYDPQFSLRHLLGVAIGSAGRRWSIHSIAEVTGDGAEMRIVGSAERIVVGDVFGSWLGVRVDAAHLRQPTDGFVVSSVGGMVGGHYQFGDLAPSLAGAFMNLWLGVGADAFDYETPGAGVDVIEAAIAEFSIGGSMARGGDIRVGYNHNRTDWAAGLATGGRGGGFFGSAFTEVRIPINDRVTLAPRLDIGSAWVGSVHVDVGFGSLR